LLNHKELSVSELCFILNVSQSSLSKHLGRLRLTGIVSDRRDGMSVYYSLVKPKEKAHKELLNAITSGLAESAAFIQDSQKLKEIHDDKKAKRQHVKSGGH
jgi:ArsR family transcriptional regulator